MLKKLSKNKFISHTLAFLLMVLPPIPLYFAAQAGAVVWMWVLMALVVTGNILAVLIR